jgi:DNA-binding MarR family transcriptional regulator
MRLDISFIDELAHLLEIVGWSQQVSLNHYRLQSLHLAFMRRAARHGRVSYSRMVWSTGMPKDAVSRAGIFLQKRGLATVKTDPNDKRRRHLYLTKAGKKMHLDVEAGMAKIMLSQIGIWPYKEVPSDSKRFCAFLAHLWHVNRFLPDGRVASDTWIPATILPGEKMEDGKVDLVALESLVWPREWGSKVSSNGRRRIFVELDDDTYEPTGPGYP